MELVQTRIHQMSPLEILTDCGGYYECVKDGDGKRLGPLVGYAGKYDDEAARKKKQWVGDVYANFAKAERHARVLEHFANLLYHKIPSIDPEAVFCGAPEGGKALAVALALSLNLQYIFPEKKVTAVATAEQREESELVFDRHEPAPGETVWIVEDVCNNFSTTATLVGLIEKYGAKVAGILCFLNRSLDVDATYSPHDGLVLPVLSVVRKPIPQYRQDDPAVAEDIANGNVVWKPKIEWHRIEAAMQKN